MSAILKHWKEAATLLLVAKTRFRVVSALQTTNYEVLMLKRSRNSKFVPSFHVFPGGVAHDSDFSPAWLELFKRTGDEVNNNLLKFLERGGPGAPIFSRKRSDEYAQVLSELAFRITAIRETFEEVGILIARDINLVKEEKTDASWQALSGKSSILSDTILNPWRERVTNNAWEFIEMCHDLSVVPDVWSLIEWSNWLTPLTARVQKTSGRRFDTAFYLCVLDYIPKAVHCEKETTELQWACSGLFLEKHANKSLQLAPPQIVELGRLLNFNEVDNLKQFGWKRSAVRAERYCPVTILCNNGDVLFVYPGDELYPELLDTEGVNQPITIPYTAAEARLKYPRGNRSEVIKDEDDRIKSFFRCSIKLDDGQINPINGVELVMQKSPIL